jgi:uncharacterized protein
MLTLIGIGVAGFVAGAQNAMAGGGSFVTLPVLLLAGLPSVTANASSTVALFPASLASTWAYRADLRPLAGIPAPLLLALSLVGGLVGAVLLLTTPNAAFDKVLPFLLLLATVAFAFGGRVSAWLQKRMPIGRGTLIASQISLSIYGGYFGGAVGIMMMAVWSLLGRGDLKTLNPVKTLLVAATNAVAVICFIDAGAVRWPQTLAMLVGAVAGGYGGALLGRRLSSATIRTGVICLTVVMTAVFFVRAFVW